MKKVKKAYRMFQRENGYFYIQDNKLGTQKSLKTTDPAEAEKLLNAANDARQTPDLNLEMATVFLNHADPGLSKRTWQDVMDEVVSHGIDSTRQRKIREFRSKAYDGIRKRPLVSTTGDDLRLVMKRGTVSTNCTLRILHNKALENGWLHKALIAPRSWPKNATRPKRGVTAEEHQKIIAAEMNEERRNYYQMLWEIGAAQSDCSLLTAEMFDWKKRVLSYRRMKTGEWCHLGIGNTLEMLAKKLPGKGLLFPKIATLKDKDRSAEFSRRIRLLKITGISLHSYRYAWAERAYAAGIPERYAQAALGHSSRAVHHAYAKSAYVICPPIPNTDEKVIPLLQPESETIAANAEEKEAIES